jgi:hypothetical protein
MAVNPVVLEVEPASPLAVTVVLPCLNEEASVGACVAEARAALEAAGYVGEVVVVDNNSTDASATVARRAGARVVPEPVAGYGAALRRGFSAARGDIIVMADADGTYPLSRLAELVEPVASDRVDFMVGARLEAATPQSMPLLHRYVGTPTLTTLVRLAGGQTRLTDSQSGFRAFRRERVEALGLSSTGMELASEMLIRAGQHGFTIGETALGYRERTGDSKLRTWSDGVRHFRLIMRLGPHLALWYPGLALMASSALLLVVSLFYPDGLAVGDVLWQPVFAASIFAVVGTCAATVGCLVGAFGPDTSASVRERFRWVRTDLTRRRLRAAASALVVLGVAIDLLLLVRWLADADPLTIQLQLATVAQVTLVVGTVLLMVAALHRLVLRNDAHG